VLHLWVELSIEFKSYVLIFLKGNYTIGILERCCKIWQWNFDLGNAFLADVMKGIYKILLSLDFFKTQVSSNLIIIAIEI